MLAAFSHNPLLASLRRSAQSIVASVLMFGLVFASVPAPLVFADELLGADEPTEVVKIAEEEEEEAIEKSEEAPETEEETSPYESPVPGGEGDQGTEGAQGSEGGEGVEGGVGEEGTPAATQDEEEVDGAHGEQGASSEELADAGEHGTSTESTEEGSEQMPTEFATTSDSTIETGDSEIDGDVFNISNTNTTNAGVTNGTSSASTTDQYAHGTTTMSVESENVGTTTNDLLFDSQTGQNVGEASGTSTIDTGDSRVRISFDNVVNTNIVNSEGLMLFMDMIGADSRGFDLRNTFDDIFRTDRMDGFLTSESTCELISCSTTLEELFSNKNDATILNDLIVRSGTGENVAMAGDACAEVRTGDVDVSVAGFNMANTNIVDSNYLLVSMNYFDGLSDDIVFPGMEFFTNMMKRGLTPGSTLSVENTNDATATNTIEVIGDTGENEVQGTSSSITTGDVDIDVRVRNDLNHNIFGGDHFYVLIRVFGEWDGDVYGLPEGLTWQHTAEGIEIFADPAYAYAGEGGATAVAGSAVASVSSMLNDNVARIDNNIGIYALTGKNAAYSENGCATIETGDINVDLGLTNMANTNVVGANWMRAFFNIFGNWEGNIAFGRPDLGVLGHAESLSGGYRPDSMVRYTFTITNFGDSPATNILLTPDFKEQKLAFLEEGENGEEGMVFPVGDLLPGESIEVTYDARVASAGALRNPQTPIELLATVHARETESDYENNTERITIVVTKDTRRNSPTAPHPWAEMGDSEIEISKKLRTAPTMQADGTASFEVTIENNGGPAYEALLFDFLYNEKGETVHSQVWELGTVEPGEEIFVAYDVHFNGSTPPGTYTNHVFIEGKNNYGRLRLSADDNAFVSMVAKAEVTIKAIEADEDLEEAVEVAEGAYCEQYLLKPIRMGAQNSIVEVAKLQTFLNRFEDAELAVNGVYDQATYDAVQVFQMKYASDILYPWSITSPTGYVYHTTMKKINDIYCEGVRTFPLTPAQILEIDRFKMRPEEFGDVGGLVDDLLIGMEPTRTDSDGDRLAEAGKPEEVEERSSQTASVSDAAKAAREASQSIRERLRERMEQLMNWVSLKYRDARFSLLSKRD